MFICLLYIFFLPKDFVDFQAVHGTPGSTSLHLPHYKTGSKTERQQIQGLLPRSMCDTRGISLLSLENGNNGGGWPF